jgi:hypothetical protein
MAVRAPHCAVPNGCATVTQRSSQGTKRVAKEAQRCSTPALQHAQADGERSLAAAAVPPTALAPAPFSQTCHTEPLRHSAPHAQRHTGPLTRTHMVADCRCLGVKCPRSVLGSQATRSLSVRSSEQLQRHQQHSQQRAASAQKTCAEPRTEPHATAALLWGAVLSSGETLFGRFSLLRQRWHRRRSHPPRCSAASRARRSALHAESE